MRGRVTMGFALAMILLANTARGQDADISDISEYLMDEAHEIALARSAAPAAVSSSATVLVLGEEGYRTAVEGANGTVCLVIRPFGAPTYIRDHYDPAYQVPECFDQTAAREILPIQLYRAELAARGLTQTQIRDSVVAAFRAGRLRRTERVSFSYMLSKANRYRPGRPGRPHIMVYLPDDYSNEILGGIARSDGIMFVEGGAHEPYTAAVIFREGIDFEAPGPD